MIGNYRMARGMTAVKSFLNLTLTEWQQAKRLDANPREIKRVFVEA